MEGANIVPVMDMNRNNNYGDCWGGGMWFMWIIVLFALMGGWGGNWNNRGNMGAEIFANGSMTRDQIADQFSMQDIKEGIRGVQTLISCKLHCVAYGPHFDEHLAKKAVAGMKNVDGTCGEHWTYEQTSQLADQQGITQKADWYYVMNMLYSDYSEIYGSDINMYIRVAKAYMRDPDAPEGKVFDLWLAQMEA